MTVFPWKSVALKWSTSLMVGGSICFDEYLAVFMKQLGLTPSQIGMTGFFGIPMVSAMFIGILADRFRARKLLLVIGCLLMGLLSLTPLLTLVTHSLQNCDVAWVNYSMTTNQSVGSISPSKNSTFFKSLNISIATEKIRNKNGAVSLNVSPLFIFLVINTVIYNAVGVGTASLLNVAIQTFNKNDKAKYGSFYCWGQIGAAISLFAVGMIASRTNITLCGQIVHGYFVSFPVAAIMMSLSLIAVHWIDYEYLEHRVISWTEIKNVIFDIHYIVVLLIGVYSGYCFSFQMHWEYWYIDHLSGGPTVLAFGGLIRRPLVALWFFLSEKVIQKIEDLPTMAVALFSFAVSQLALSFIHNPWLVLIIDIFQSMGFALSYSALCVHFSKAGTNASSAVILAIAELSFKIGQGIGATSTGWFFMTFGPKSTLFYYGIFTMVVFLSSVGFIFGSKNLVDYEIVADSDSNEK